jgi:sugar diacid utilization regulator
LTTDVDNLAYALVAAATEPRSALSAGTWPWLVGVVAAVDDPQGPPWVAAGVPATTPGDLGMSARTAAQVAALRRHDPALGVAPTAEEQWAMLTVDRAVDALAAGGREDALAGPVAVLAEHDRRRHTAYLVSLAAWLDYPGEPTAAAKTLGVHVNTLRHRMVRMSEVAPLCLDEPTERLAIRLQLAARRL